MRVGERGGAAILVALALLVLLFTAGVGTVRAVVREYAMAATALQGAQAAAAADSGLAWFQAAVARPGGPVPALLRDLEGQGRDGAPAMAAVPGPEEDPMPGPANQGFTLTVRRLGLTAPDRAGTPGTPPGTPPGAETLWLITATGTAQRPGGTYRNVREWVASTPHPLGDPSQPLGLRPRAWRVVR